jgi:hypothetical protein
MRHAKGFRLAGLSHALSGGPPAAAAADHCNPMPPWLFMQRLAEGLIHEAPFRARKVVVCSPSPQKASPAIQSLLHAVFFCRLR